MRIQSQNLGYMGSAEALVAETLAGYTGRASVKRLPLKVNAFCICTTREISHLIRN